MKAESMGDKDRLKLSRVSISSWRRRVEAWLSPEKPVRITRKCPDTSLASKLTAGPREAGGLGVEPCTPWRWESLQEAMQGSSGVDVGETERAI